MPGGDEPLGEIASVVLFENERVKIWNLIVEPGEASPWHFHENDYVTVTVEGGGLTVEYEDGNHRGESFSSRDMEIPRPTQGPPSHQQHSQPVRKRPDRAEGLSCLSHVLMAATALSQASGARTDPPTYRVPTHRDSDTHTSGVRV